MTSDFTNHFKIKSNLLWYKYIRIAVQFSMMQKFHRATILDTQLKGVVGILVAVLTKNPSFTILLVLTYYSAELYCVILLAIVAIFWQFQQLLAIVSSLLQLLIIVCLKLFHCCLFVLVLGHCIVALASVGWLQLLQFYPICQLAGCTRRPKVNPTHLK